jgi:hypothetical protein
MQPKADGESKKGAAWLTAYSPGVLSASQAAPIRVGVGENLVIDLRLPSNDGYKIMGEVASAIPAEYRLSPVRLFLTRRDAGAPPLERVSAWPGTLTLPPGSNRFEIEHVPPGSYELFALAQRTDIPAGPLGPNPYYLSRTSLDVVDHDVSDIALVLQPGVDVKGKLTVAGDASGFHLFQSRGGGGGVIVGTQVSVSLRVNDGSPVGTIRPPKIDGDTFAFHNIPEGTYSLSVSVAGSTRTAYVADIRSGPQSIVGQNLIIGRAEPPPLNIVVNADGGTVPIAVTGKAHNTALVVLVPQSPYERDSFRFRRTLVNDPAGRVSLNYVPPGAYKLYAWDYPAGLPEPFMDPDFMARYSQRGVPLKVTSGVPVDIVEVPLITIEPIP